MKKLLFTLAFLIFSFFLFAQDSMAVHPEETTGMRANEKVYVVAAVLATILIGLFIYIIRLDKKISKLERGDKT